jgi:predicted phage terminase large subunit-like protein
MPELMAPESLIPLSHSILGGRNDCRWHAQRTFWSFASGARLSFGHCEREDDKYNYKSAAYQFIGFDEASAFSETVYTYLFSRLRKSTKIGDIPLRVRCASNPDGIGSQWLKRRFITEGQKHGRVFIPAKIDDNPFLDRTSYLRSLSNLDPYTRSQLLDGNWDAKPPGAKFHRSWFANRIVEAVPSGMQRVRFWDLASTSPQKGTDPDYTVGTLMGVSEGKYYILDVRRDRNTPKHIEDLVSVTAALDGQDVMIRMEQEPGSGGVNTISTYTRLLAKYDFQGIKSTGSKEVRANPFSAQCQAGNVYLLSGTWIEEWVSELELFPYSAHDDQCLAEGTSIYTKRGHIPIEQVNESDYTMTRNGFQKVEWAGITAENAQLWELELSDGQKIVGTANHPIYTKEFGFLNLCQLKTGMELLSEGGLKPLSSTEESIEDTPTPSKETIESTTLITQSGKKLPVLYIETFGNLLMGLFRQITSSITRTATLPTTTLKILPAYIKVNIWNSMQRLGHLIRRKYSPISIVFDTLPFLGTRAMPDASGIGSTPQNPCLSTSESWFADCAKGSSNREQAIGRSALVVADPRANVINSPILSPSNALPATRNLPVTNRTILRTAQRSVLRVCERGRGRVYNLRVANQHEYFANGILVHNCDSASSAFLVCADLESTSTLDDILVVGNVQKPQW